MIFQVNPDRIIGKSVNGFIQDVKTVVGKTRVSVHQAGQMPSPVVLKVEFENSGNAINAMSNAKMIDENTALVTWPVDVWFNGSRTFIAELSLGARKIKRITLDPSARFPDKDTSDKVWPREGIDK